MLKRRSAQSIYVTLFSYHMDYDSIGDMSPSISIKQRFYEQYVEPLLKETPSAENLAYLLDESYAAWRLDIKKKDLSSAQFVEWMCTELRKTHEPDLIRLISTVLSQTHDVNMRAETAERNAYNAKLSGNVERFWRDTLDQYKVLFESDFRLWATVPYFYICKVYKVDHDGTDPAAFPTIGASEKLVALRDIKMPLPQGNPKDLVIGFDNKLRNAGAGHESWELSDDDTVVLHFIDPKTGEPKGQKSLNLNKKEIGEQIKQCLHTLWVLRMGVTLFLNNTPEFVAKLDERKNYKAREIRNHLEQFACNRWFAVEEFEVDTARSQVSIELKYSPKLYGEKGQVFFGNGERYDLVTIEEDADYGLQVLGILQYMVVSFFETPPAIDVVVRDEKSELVADLKFDSSETIKLTRAANESDLPVPAKGSLPDRKCRIGYQVRVPFGSREFFERELEKRGKKTS